MPKQFSDDALAIMMTAVRIARDEQIRTVSILRSRLLQRYPGKDADIKAALDQWANYANRFKE